MSWADLDVTVPERGDADARAAPAVLGRFELGKKLGTGGMGVVFAARDPLLEREVAVKLVLPDGADPAGEGRARLLREAQALAKLSHPNVVTVYEVGVAGDELFIAMELIDGSTLRDWLRSPRSWRAIVEVFLAAGRGLAAAHALGLVHRDFKPGNVLLDRQGVAKVSDFGLVAAASAGAAAGAPIGGTPAYMAPEQAAGAAVDGRADQYSFGVSLREALGRAAPPRVRAIVDRCTAAAPAARYPSMVAVLAALDQVRRRPRWRVPAAVAAAVLAASGVTAALTRGGPAVEVCPVPEAQVASAWSAPRRIAIGARAGAVDPARGPARIAAAAALFDGYSASWSAMHVAACRATRVEGAQSDALLDRRMACLDRRLAELRGAVDRFATVNTVADLDAASGGAVELAPLAECADTAALARVVPLPDDPAARARVAQVEAEVDAILEASRAGQVEGLPARAEAAVVAARATGYPPTLAAALDALERVQRTTAAIDAELATARELAEVAAAAHSDVAAARSLIDLALLIGRERHRPDEALTLLTAARAAVARVGSPPSLQSALVAAEGTILAFTPRQDEAIAKLAEAVRLGEDAVARSAPADRVQASKTLVDRQVALAVARAQAGDHDGAAGLLRAAIARYHELYGGDHAAEATAWANLGFVYGNAGQAPDAIAAFEEATRIAAARIGDSPILASMLANLAGAFNLAGRFDDAVAALDRAQAMLAPDDGFITQLLGTRAIALEHLGRLDDAAAAYDQTIALLGRPGADPEELAAAYYNRAELQRERGRCGDALADYGHAGALWIQVGGADTAWQIYAHHGTGRCLVELGRAAEAIAPLTRAASLATSGPGALERAAAGYYLGRALVESGRDRRGGLARVRAARVDLAAFGDETRPELDELDAWLARAERPTRR